MVTTINAGKAVLTHKGEWSDATAYSALDWVTHGGSTYVCKTDAPAGTPLTNDTYWILMAQRGDTAGVFVYTDDEADDTILTATNAGDIIFRVEEIENDDGTSDDGTDDGAGSDTDSDA